MTTETKTVNPIHAARIRALMERHRMTQPQTAEYLGVPLTTLANWLYGQREPNAGTVRLLDVLGMVEALAPDIHAGMIPRK